MIIGTLARIARELVRPTETRTCDAGHRSMHGDAVCGAIDYSGNVCRAGFPTQREPEAQRDG